MKRTTLITIGLFAILLVAAVLINDRPVQRGAEKLSFASLDPAAVDSLTLQGPDEAVIELTKEGEVWTLADGHMADPDMVKRALEGLQSVDSSEVLSTSEARRANYGVDVDSGTTVEAAAGGKKLVRLVIGNAEAGGSSIREVGEDPIFKATTSLNHLFPLDQKRWLKLRFVDGTLEDARRVELDLADGTAFAIEPASEGNEWALTDPSLVPEDFRFDGSGARSLASAAVSLRAGGIVEDVVSDEDAGLSGAHDRVTVVTRDGRSTVHLGGKAGEKNEVYARVDGRDALFTIPEYQAKNLRKRPLDLRDLRLMQIVPEDAVALTVKATGVSPRFVKNEDGSWAVDPEGPQPPEGFPFAPASVTRVLQSMQNLRATALAEGVSEREARLDRSSVGVSVTLADGSAAELVFGKETQGENDATLYYAGGNADGKVYTVAEYHRDRFDSGWESFRVVEPPPQQMGGGNNPFANLDPETLKNLPPEVRESILKQMREQQQQQQLMEQIKRQQGG